MGKVIITNDTTKEPIQMIGKYAGECWGADTTVPSKNFKRGINCLNSEHGRTWEFPDVYMTIEGYSARVIREWYTHIGGAPSRLQASTRYINYDSFEYITPPKIANNEKAKECINEIENIKEPLYKFEKNNFLSKLSSVIDPSPRLDIIPQNHWDVRSPIVGSSIIFSSQRIDRAIIISNTLQGLSRYFSIGIQSQVSSNR